MSYNLPGEMNPFEAPRAGIGEEARYLDLGDNDAEMIRREHIGREANIKSLGQLYYLGTFFGLIGTIGLVLMALGVIPTGPGQPGVDPSVQKITFGIAAVFYLFLTVFNGVMGYGLTHLQVWSRWTAVAFVSLGLLATLLYTVVLSLMVSPVAGLVVLAIGGGFNGLILWLLVSRKAGVVFSREYKEIILKTPHVKMKTSLFVKIILIIFIAIILFGFLAAMFNRSNG